MSGKANIFGLAPQELEALKWICEGKRYKDVAQILGKAPQTIKNQASAILRKTNSVNMVQAVIKCVKAGLI